MDLCPKEVMETFKWEPLWTIEEENRCSFQEAVTEATSL